MKLSIYKYVLIFLITGIVAGCDNKNDSTLTSGPTLDAFLTANPQLSMFSKALDKAGLESFKTGPGPFTWFAPSNDAFTAAKLTEDSLNKLTQGQINFLMLYHLANASLPSGNLIAVNSAPRTTQLGGTTNQIYFGSVNGDTYINGSKITNRDNRLANGYIHVIDRFLIPPALKGNIQTVLTATGQHTLFIQALTKAGLWANLGTTAVFTIFAPTDAAMTAAGYTSTSIAAATGATLTALTTAMKYQYILNVRLFTNDLIRTSLPSTAAGSSFYITPSDNGTKLKGKNNPAPVNIVTPNILGTNGVVHIIDGVLKS